VWVQLVRAGDRLNGHHHSLSSLLSMARRCSREHDSQYMRCLPFSTAVVQVRVDAPSGAVVPQKEQMGTLPPYAPLAARLYERNEPGGTDSTPYHRAPCNTPAIRVDTS
jgi:predicted component of type VI protein secretion system